MKFWKVPLAIECDLNAFDVRIKTLENDDAALKSAIMDLRLQNSQLLTAISNLQDAVIQLQRIKASKFDSAQFYREYPSQ